MVKRRESRRHRKNVRQIFQRTAQAKQASAQAAIAAAPPPSSFQHNYGAGVLQSYGPLIIAKWHAPPALREALTTKGEAVPVPVFGALMLDTGATGTCISVKAAEALGLKPTRILRGFGSGGAGDNPMYFAEVEISIASKDGQITTILRQQEVRGIPELEKPFEAFPPRYAGGAVEIIGLLGRDILSHTRFRYDGLAGTLAIDFDLVSLQQRT